MTYKTYNCFAVIGKYSCNFNKECEYQIIVERGKLKGKICFLRIFEPSELETKVEKKELTFWQKVKRLTR